jgi:hypothetical protein
VAKHLIDSDLYIDLVQRRSTLPILRELYENDAPGIYFCSIVIQELLAGVPRDSGKAFQRNASGPDLQKGRRTLFQQAELNHLTTN